jgi:hypothetical protein
MTFCIDARGMDQAKPSQISTHNPIEARNIAGGEHPLLPVPTTRERTAHGNASRAPHLRSHHLLLIGPDELAEDFLEPLITSGVAPVVYLDAADPAFPSTCGGTLIVRHVERLTTPQQEQFLEWLSAQTEITCVIATSPRPLFPRVQRGTFSEQLYYRLNTVIVELNHR